MKIFQGRRAKNFEEAVVLAFREARGDGMSTSVTDLFATVADASRLRGQAEKAIGTAIRDRYKKKPVWKSNSWYVPVPMLRYDGRDIPHLALEITVYLVAAVEVETANDFYSVTLVGAIGKPETLVIPMVVLHAILNDDLGRFGILARSGSHTTWDVPGAKPVHLPNDFSSKLSEILIQKSVAVWLADFGSQGRSVASLVVGNLLGLQFQDKIQSIPAAEERWTPESLIDTLERMAYSRAEAREMLNRAGPALRVDHTFEEALRIVLQQTWRRHTA